jgi:dTDP-4-amino-4,6-dideoxygalactose transaminase
MIPLFKVYMADSVYDKVPEVLMSGYIGQGSKVDEFEAAFKAFCGEDVLTTNSCTSALDLALHLCGVGPGDEVVTTAQTCTATNGVIVRRFATPVFVDIDPATGNLVPADVGRCITAKTKAIMAVDWGGRPCDYEALKSFGLPVIEDAAHAVGSLYKGGHVAQTGADYVCFSFQAIKHLTTGDGGAIKVPKDQYERAKLLRWYGLDRTSKKSFRCEQNIGEVGYKYHMNDIAATIGLANLPYLPELLEKHRDNAKFYCRNLTNVRVPEDSADSSWWIYTILVKDPPKFIEKMKAEGIDCSPVHARNDTHSAFREHGRISTRQAGIDYFSSQQVSIPVGWWLSQEDREKIVEAVEKCT